MVRSAAATVPEYLAALAIERRPEIEQVRTVVLRNLPTGYKEVVSSQFIAYVIPLERYPNTYNGQPLYYAALGVHKSYNTLYLMGAYGDPGQRAKLEAGFKKSGKKMDMGKSCLHFKSAADLPLDTIGELIAAIPSEKWIAMYEESRKIHTKRKPAKTKPKSKTKASK
ncbi:MAG: DUF1801 domain-containing protein [Gemmatimonadetes bacterium]|nr:DUF1801 domain-containing protein [Gemmatimonadota bacterium]